jgi:hypothetical protein
VVVIIPVVMVATVAASFLMCIICVKEYVFEEEQWLDFSKCGDLTAKTCCLSKLSVLPICREANKVKE